MAETKSKVDVKAIMARAQSGIKKIVKSTEKIQSKTDTYRLVPGLSKYEFNGMILRNAGTKNIVSFKTGRTKYQLKNDKGVSQNLNKEEIKALFPADAFSKKEKTQKEPKAPKAPKAERVKKPAGEKVYTGVKHVVKPMDLKLMKPDARKIMESDVKSYDQILALHKAGYSKPEIIEITGRRNDVVSKYLRPFLKSAGK